MINTWDQSYAAPPNFVKISGAHRMTPAMAWRRVPPLGDWWYREGGRGVEAAL